MRRTALTVIFSILLSALAGTLCAQEQVVYIDGVKYRVHSVEKGETLYSLSKRYGVPIEEMVASNPALSDGLKAGQKLKIPFDGSRTEKAEKKPKRKFNVHVVAKGETLYSISRRYAISVDALMADNGNIDPSKLSVGTKLYIRKSEIGQTDATEARQELQRHSEVMSSVADGGFGYHVVHSGETASDIAQRFGTKETDLLALNGYSRASDLKEGSIIKVPVTPVHIYVPNQEREKAESAPDVRFSTLKDGTAAQVALMLPLRVEGCPMPHYVDFYQGFLLGLDDIRRNGHSVNVRLFNTAHDSSRIQEILSSGRLDGSDLIVGPVYEDEIIQVSKYAEQHSIPLVSPLANMVHAESDAVFQMSPGAETKFDKVRNLFDGSKRVVLISGETNDTEFESEVLQMLEGRPYERHRYAYEHPSVIERRQKEYEEALSKGQQATEYKSPSDLSPLLQNDTPSVFVVLSDNEIEVDRILAALASANISLTSRSRTVAPFVVFGNTRWNRYRNIDRAIFFTDNVVMLSTYHVRRNDERIRDFDSRYAESFGTVPSLYSYRGYDAAMIFIQSLYGGIENGLAGQRFMPLQTPYSFERNGRNGIRVNSEWVRVNYNSNFTITTE